MFSQFYYLLRSRTDGQYLVANVETGADAVESGYLLMFKEDFEARSYLNAHARDVASHFAIESISAAQIKPLLQRWGFAGVGVVEDPLVPSIKFLSQS